MSEKMTDEQKQQLRRDVEALWPKMEAGMRYLGRESGDDDMPPANTDPRPAATEAANVFIDEPGPEPPRNIMIRAAEQNGCDDGEGGAGFVVDAILAALHDAGLTIATAPLSGPVCVSRETAVRIWQRLPERTLTITTGSAPDLVEFARAIQHAIEGDQS